MKRKINRSFDDEKSKKYLMFGRQNGKSRIVLEEFTNTANWKEFKRWLIDYRFNKTGSHEDGRYCVAISVTDLLKKMEEYEERWKRK